MKYYIKAFILIIASQWSMSIFAGGAPNCEQDSRIEARTFHKATTMAVKVRNYLIRSKARVALVGRVGSDKRNRGIKYTHVGLILKDHRKGRWLFTHLLNSCGANGSTIFDQGLINFYLDDLFSFDTVVVTFSPQLQDSIADTLHGPLVKRLHNRKYSSLAHPFNPVYQNSNQWALEIIAASQMNLGARATRKQVQKILKTKGYRPARMYLSDFEISAVESIPNVSLNDHWMSENNQGGFLWVSAKSVINYLKKTDDQTVIRKLSI